MQTLDYRVNELEKNSALMRAEQEQQKNEMEKSNHHFEEVSKQINSLELKLEGWLKYFKGTTITLILCASLIGGIGGWASLRIIDANDRTNDEQNKLLEDHGRAIIDIDNQLKNIIDIISKKSP